MEKNSLYRGIIWDWNGTLLDDAWLCVEVLNGILQKRGRMPVTAGQYEEFFDFPVKDYYARLGFDFSVEPFETLADEFIVEYDRRRFECRLREATLDVLNRLRSRNCVQTVLSAYHQVRLDEAVRFFDIEAFFTHRVGLDDHYAGGKIENGKRLMRDLSIPPDQVLLVGDTVHDYQVACALGIDCVLVPSGHHARSKLSACGVRVVDSLTDVLRV